MTEFRRNVVILFIAMAFVAPVAWMLSDREPPYDIEHVEIAPPQAVAGEDIAITFHVSVNRAACSPGLIYREFKELASGKLHLYDPVLRSAPPRIENNQFSRIVKLPANITPGPTVYRGQACYTCNPLQLWLRWPVCATAPDTPFDIMEKRDGVR